MILCAKDFQVIMIKAGNNRIFKCHNRKCRRLLKHKTVKDREHISLRKEAHDEFTGIRVKKGFYQAGVYEIDPFADLSCFQDRFAFPVLFFTQLGSHNVFYFLFQMRKGGDKIEKVCFQIFMAAHTLNVNCLFNAIVRLISLIMKELRLKFI